MHPVYRDGDFLIISPAAHVRRHDRIVLKPRSGQLLAGVLMRRTAQRVELAHLAREEESLTFSLQEVDWIARIVWASQ